MTPIASRLLLLAAVSAIGLFAADNSIGTWKRNIQKVHYDQGAPPANPIVEQIIVIEPVDGGVKITSKGRRKDGTPINTTSVRKYDGNFHQVTGEGAQFDTVSMRQIDANTFTSESKKTGGKYHTTSKIVISPDGKTLTQTSKGTNAEGKPVSFTAVYDRQ